MYIEFPVMYSSKSQEDAEREETLGIKIEDDPVPGVIHVRLESITAHNENSNGDLVLRLNDGSTWNILMPHSSFLELLHKLKVITHRIKLVPQK